jgi:predicted transport protein
MSLGEVNHKPIGRWHGFYKGKTSTKSLFAVIMLKKGSFKVRIRTDPKTFKDDKNLAGERMYKGWFYKQGQERQFEIKEKGQIEYALELIKHSYKISG